jgi:hypothetical protein
VHVEAAYLLTPSHTVQGSGVNCAGFGQKLLAGQFWQMEAPAVAVNLPASHEVHAESAIAEQESEVYFPGPHVVHVEHMDAPEPMEYVLPATQLAHEEESLSELAVPGPHALHTAFESVVQTVDTYFPGLQLAHDAQTALDVTVHLDTVYFPVLH